MNSYTGNRSQTTSSAASFDSYQFDFGLAGAGRSSGSRPLRDQKPSAPLRPSASTASSSWSYQPSSNNPSWTHQPASATATATAASSSVGRSGNLTNSPASMVGDIFGKSWTSAAPPSSSSGSGLGIPKSDPKLFSDLVGSALGRGGTSVGSAPLKSTAPKTAFSMGNLSDSLPRYTPSATSAPTTTSGAPVRPGGYGSADSFGNFTSFNQSGPKIGTTPIGGIGQTMKSMAGGPPMNAKKDPFGSLMDFGSKPSAKAPMSSAADSSNVSAGGDGDFFGAFQNANSTKKKNDFGTQGQSFKTPTPPPPVQQPAPASKSATDTIDMFFTSSAPPAAAASEMNDWDLGSEFMGDDSSGPTTELDGLPPPPAGVTASSAKIKGMDNYKQGQFADAIKWLSWAVSLLEKSADSESMHEVLSCRASCYKEAGEYKKAVADCSKLLEHDSANVTILVQRALLYESMEKYRLGAEDLRMVLKIDPGNRLARSTIHRLNKFAD